jgi:hypothetical protein
MHEVFQPAAKNSPKLKFLMKYILQGKSKHQPSEFMDSKSAGESAFDRLPNGNMV